MPFIPEPGLELPNDTATIWRYMDLWKFQSILKTSALYFVRSDRFRDPLDSVLPAKWREKIQGVLPDWYEDREIPTNPILCWNCDENESERMWHEYTSGTDALVIRSTVGRFKECFSSTSAQVRIGLVTYGDHDALDDPKFVMSFWGDNDPPARLNPWYMPRYFKLTKWDYEKEIRATIHIDSKDQPIDPGYNLVIGSLGICTLIESIHLHPNATTDQCKQLRTLLDHHGLCNILLQSSALG